MDMNSSKLWEIVKDREVWRAAVHGVTKRHDWKTEQQQQIPGLHLWVSDLRIYTSKQVHWCCWCCWSGNCTLRIIDLKEQRRGHQHRHPPGLLHVIFIPFEVCTDKTARGSAGFVWWNHPLALIEVSPVSESSWCLLFSHSVVSLCDPMDCSTPGFPLLHHLPGLAQTHVHWVSDAIQPSHPLTSPSPPAFNLSQHQGLFQCQLFTSGGQSIGASASVFPMNIQGWFISEDPQAGRYLIIRDVNEGYYKYV